ncbi:hypothetical protein DICPUDRAFT_97180 [Dictyostelium purpureum]|uniref:Integral membrane bound transporter domain-containing protein n=1 Tax=Dictyostelium purpureum TaxID=5786 RepID=F0ZEH1_DICPU|nr:uncharacterized protein DICPUDRAFT_97180 [Dictyostelium purpureum]EGC37646.1 hypothetical protein DICPUDRAFT_97180 [Dictyostelium purpureum]|eukprot:XP_003285834.1 hypothetical protein DICPUDRAFT_97180 [Dictyostelium purpureum]
MNLLKHLVNNTVFLYLQRKERLYILNYLFFALVLAWAYSAGLIFLVINCFRIFYNNLETLWISILSVFVLSNTDNYYQVIKDSIKHTLAIFIGGVVSIASISIVGRHLWPNVFIMLVFYFVGSGFFLTSNFFNFLHAKNMFITYYFMVFLVHFPRPFGDYFYSPVPQLKFLSVAVLSLIVCVVTCSLLRYSFATGLFVQVSNQLLKQSSCFIKLLGKDLGIHIIKSVNCDRDNLNSLEDEVIYNRIRDSLFKGVPCNQLLCNRLLSKEKKETLDSIQFVYHEYSRLLNKLDCVYKQSKKEFWSKNLFIHLERVQILFERNHKKLYALKFGLDEDFPIEICNRIIPLIPYIETLLKECEYIFCVMSKQLSLRYTHDETNKGFIEWFENHHNNLESHNYDKPINETKINNTCDCCYYNDDIVNTIDKDSFSECCFKDNIHPFNQTLDETLKKNKDSFRTNSMEWYQIQINNSFETINSTVLKMQSLQNRNLDRNFLTDPEYKDIISRVSFFVRGFEKFSMEQKTLSTQIFLLSYHNSLNRRYPQEIKLLIGYYNWIVDYFKNYKENKRLRQQLKQKESEAFPPNLQVMYTRKEKLKIIIEYFIFKRLLFNWLFSLKYAVACSTLAIAVYEITIHSSFILFQNMDWTPIIFIVSYSPIIGALPIVTFLRIIGTILGGFMGYAALVLMGLVGSRVSQAFVYIGFSFFTITFSFLLVKLQAFEKLVIFIVFGYSVITQFQYETWTHDIIASLLRIMYLCIGILLVMIVGYILPYYDYRQLEKNIYQVPFGIIRTFTFLMSFSFIKNETVHNHNDHNIHNSNNNIPHSYSNNSLNNDTISEYSLKSYESLESTSSLSSSWSRYLEQYDDIIPELSRRGLSFQHYRMLISKISIELRSNFPIQRTLLMDAKFELMFRTKKFKRIEHIYLEIEQLHNIFGALDFIVSESNQVNLQIIGGTVKSQLMKLLNEMNTTAHYLYNIAAFKKDRFKQEKYKTVDRDNSLQLCEELLDGIRSNINTFNLTIVQIQHLNAIIFILNQFVQQYNLVFNLLYDFIKRIDIKRVRTNNLNITKPNQVQNLEGINYHNNVNEEIKDIRNYQIFKLLKK